MFFRLPKGDALFLAGLVLFYAAAFLLPALRTAKLSGIALFGWWMAALMVLGPLIALLRLVRGVRRRRR